MANRNKYGSNDINRSNSGSSENTNINRRGILRKSFGIASGIGSLGVAGIGSVGAASSNCTESANFYQNFNYAWHEHDNAESLYDCPDASFAPFNRLLHTASVIYVGSVEAQTREWIHEFMVTGHAEHFEKSTCGGDWSMLNGLQKHTANFDLNDPSLAIGAEAEKFVKSHPEYDGGGDIPNAWMDWAYTGMSIAVTYSAPTWVGTAMAITGTLMDHIDGTDLDGNYDLTYKWGHTGGDYYNDPPCASHFIKQLIDGTNTSGAFSFDYVDEAWGIYPTYTQVQFLVETDSPVINSSATNTVTDQSIPKAGDYIESSEGEDVRVTDVSETTISKTQKSDSIVPVSSLSSDLQKRVRDKETVRYKRFPATVKKVVVSGRRVD